MMSVIYLVDRGLLALLWVLSVWALCPLCLPGHLQKRTTFIDMTLIGPSGGAGAWPLHDRNLTIYSFTGFYFGGQIRK